MNGSPKLHENNDPTLGGSVLTTLFAKHSVALPCLPGLMKSRGSTGNIWPPIWNAIVCADPQGRVGSALEFAAKAGETDEIRLFTTSDGPRMTELP